MTESFNYIITTICNHAMLIVPCSSDALCVFVDASTTGVGGVLCVSRDDTWMPTAFYSRQLQSREIKDSATELEALALLLTTIEHFSYYLSGREFVAYTDHIALTHILDKTPNSNKLHRWKERLSLFDVTIIYLPGKRNLLAGCIIQARMATTAAATSVAALNSTKPPSQRGGRCGDPAHYYGHAHHTMQEED